jgi:hypothetical protein
MHAFVRLKHLHAHSISWRSHLFWLEACMSRDDLLFWLSIVWFAALLGALAWAFIAL